jgi:hypothetical protein
MWPFDLGRPTMKASVSTRTARKAPPTPVNLDQLTAKELDALPEDVFLASLRPHARRIAETAYALKGVFKKVK